MARPERTIDWEQVDRMLEAQCTAKEIAGTLGMHVETLYDRVKSKYGINYTDYSEKLSSRGLFLLRAAQFKKALSGNPQILTWLGKQYLKQSETPADASVSEIINSQYEDLMYQLKSLQSERNIADSSIRSEQKS